MPLLASGRSASTPGTSSRCGVLTSCRRSGLGWAGPWDVYMTGVAPQYAEYAPLGLASCMRTRRSTPPRASCSSRDNPSSSASLRPTIELTAPTPPAAIRAAIAAAAAPAVITVNPAAAKGCNRRCQTGTEDTSLAQVGIAHHRFPRCGRIVRQTAAPHRCGTRSALR
jgi:hypothetical protein